MTSVTQLSQSTPRSFRRFDPEPRHIERRQENQREQGCNRKPAHDGVGHGAPEHCRCDRNHAEDGGSSSEQNRAQAMLGRAYDGVPGLLARIYLLINLDNQDDRVSDHHADQ